MSTLLESALLFFDCEPVTSKSDMSDVCMECGAKDIPTFYSEKLGTYCGPCTVIAYKKQKTEFDIAFTTWFNSKKTQCQFHAEQCEGKDFARAGAYWALTEKENYSGTSMEIPEHLMRQLDVLIEYQIDVKLCSGGNVLTAGVYVDFAKKRVHESGGSVDQIFTDIQEGPTSLLSRIVCLHYNRWTRSVEQNQQYKTPEDCWKRLYNTFGLPWKLGFK